MTLIRVSKYGTFNENLDAKNLLSSVFEVKVRDIPDDAALDNFERWDSLGHFRLINQIEEQSGFPLETEEILNSVDLKSIQQLLNELKIRRGKNE